MKRIIIFIIAMIAMMQIVPVEADVTFTRNDVTFSRNDVANEESIRINWISEVLPEGCTVEEINGQIVFFGNDQALKCFWESLTRQQLLELAIVDRYDSEYYARIKECQKFITWDDNGVPVSARDLTSDMEEYTILRNGALLIENQDGLVDVFYTFDNIKGINDYTYPRTAYSEQERALYESYTLAACYPNDIRVRGTLSMKSGFDYQDIFNALVIGYDTFEGHPADEVGFFFAWRVVDFNSSVSTVNVQPTAKPTSKPSAEPTPAHSTPRPTEGTGPAHSTPRPTATARPSEDEDVFVRDEPTNSPSSEHSTPTPTKSSDEDVFVRDDPTEAPAHSTPAPTKSSDEDVFVRDNDSSSSHSNDSDSNCTSHSVVEDTDDDVFNRD